MTALDQVLEHLGYSHRQQQDALFEVLQANQRAVVIQAGTGTGKSIGVLAAAAERGGHEPFGEGPALVVVPTNILMTQYVEKDAPAVEAALGVKIRALKGRSHYLCASSAGMRREAPKHLDARLLDDEPYEVLDSYYGCPGSDECRYDELDPAGWPCHYRLAKKALDDADIIITNAHLLIIDYQLKAGAEDPEEGPRIFPDYCALFIDEAHTIEEVARGFTESSISTATAMGMGEAGVPFVNLMEHWQRVTHQPTEIVQPQIPYVAAALAPLARWMPPEGTRAKQNQMDLKKAAARVLADGSAGVFQARHRILWFDPQRFPKRPRLVGTQINLAGMLGAILDQVPTALVSATIPQSLTGAVGIPHAEFVDVGHPFDYARQATIEVSSHSAAYREGEATGPARAAELLERIRNTDGGVLLLFSAFKDLNWVLREIGPALAEAGRKVYVQEDGVDKADLTRRFKADGRGVLFGSASFATGFDVPGDALRGVAIWKLPYPGLDPVTRAISAVNRQRYEDMMLVAAAQAIGRLIRTTSDTGWVWIGDVRAARVLLGRNDPMLRHLREFRRVIAREGVTP